MVKILDLIYFINIILDVRMKFILSIISFIILLSSINSSLGLERNNLINEVLEKVKKGEDFSKVYEEYSYKSKGEYILEYQKDTGFLKKNIIDKNIGRIVFNMNIGDISNIIKTKDGYHIVKVIDKKKDLIRLELISFINLKWRDKNNEEIGVNGEFIPEIETTSSNDLTSTEKVYIPPYNKKDMIFISSIPLKGEVYIESVDDKEPLFDFRNFRGIAPLYAKIEEGEYKVGIEIPTESFNISIDNSISIDLSSSYIMTILPENDINPFEWDNEDLVRMTVKDGILVRIAKIYKIKKIKNRKAILISLFQPKDPYSLPYNSTDELFDFDENKLYNLLLKENVSKFRIKDIIKRIHKFGKIILRDKNRMILITISQDGNFNIIKKYY
jgi:hypothetical protein